MLIEFKNFILGVRPSREVLQEEMFNLTLDGYPASLSDVEKARGEEERGLGWRVSPRLYKQAGFLRTNPGGSDEEEANRILKQADEFADAERQVISSSMAKRVGGGRNENFRTSAPWVEMDMLDRLRRFGNQIGIVDYPIVAVSFMKIAVGEIGETGIFRDLVGAQLDLDWMSWPDNLDKKYRPDMRVHWYGTDESGCREWSDKALYAVGTIRTF